MKHKLEKIDNFLQQHHVLSLATTNFEDIHICSLFYVYSKENNSFIIASSYNTQHIEHILVNNNISGNILLETKNITKIQGVQCKGVINPLNDISLKKLYFKAFPYSFILAPILWKIDVKYFKMTDNTLGFGTKIILNF